MAASITAETSAISIPLAWIVERHDALQREHDDAMRDPAYRADSDRRLREVSRRVAALLRRMVEARAGKTKPPRRRERPAPRRRRASVRSSAKSGDSPSDDSEPSWPRRVAARLSLRLADAAGWEALIYTMRGDADRRRWSA
jgi:hypothetical protein